MMLDNRLEKKRLMQEINALLAGKAGIVVALSSAEEELRGDDKVCPAESELLDHAAPKYHHGVLLGVIAIDRKTSYISSSDFPSA